MWVHTCSPKTQEADGRVHDPVSGRKQMLLNRNVSMADKMSQWEKVPATKPGYPGSTHMMDGEN